jgi:Uma2 family endonuclease
LLTDAESSEPMNLQVPTIRRPATYRDILDAPEGMVAELIDGALHLQPRPRSRHARASSMLGAKLTPAFDEGVGGPGGWWLIDEPEIHLGEDVLVPDIAGWRRERLPVFPDAPHFALRPDWVCEVLSPSTRTYDLTAKRAIYARHGVNHLWFVDPDAKTLEAFELRGGSWTLIAALHDNEIVSIAPFDAVGFDLGVLWTDIGSQ